MSSYIETAKQQIRKIAEKLHSMEAKDMRYGLVCYRDHPPQDSTYATKVFPLTPSISKMQGYVDTMSAEGGGDGPESVACALHEALKSDWRKNSVRVCVVIADAPPHGLGESGDGFPNGCPCGHDPLAIARKMAEEKIIIYSVAVEPSLGNYKNGRAFFKGIAQTTHGRFLSLGQAQLLPDVIIGGSAEELDLKKIEDEIATEVAKVKSESPAIADAEVETRVQKNLADRGLKTWHLDVTHQEAVVENESIFMLNESLASAKEEISKKSSVPAATTSSGWGVPSFISGLFGSSSSSAPPPPSSSSDSFSGFTFAPSSSSHRDYSSQAANVYKSEVSHEQVSRVMKKNRL